VAASRRSDRWRLFARLDLFAGLIGSYEAVASSDLPPNRRQPTRSPVGKSPDDACFEPEQQQAFMADVWKLLNRHFRKL
jgi:hypothetical protein